PALSQGSHSPFRPRGSVCLPCLPTAAPGRRLGGHHDPGGQLLWQRGHGSVLEHPQARSHEPEPQLVQGASATRTLRSTSKGITTRGGSTAPWAIDHLWTSKTKTAKQ